jgi:protein phosphatase
MGLSLSFAVRSDVGLLREGNEDAAYAGPRLLAVADGMGGHAGGEVASRIAIESIASLDDDVPGTDVLAALRDAITSAQHGIRDRVDGDGTLEGMGTTLTALLWTGSRLGVAHVGDSRAYLLRGGALEQITHDHTYVQELVDAGRITADEAHAHPQRSLLTRALDGRDDPHPDLSVREVRAGDRFLLCTDGLCGVVSDETIGDALADGTPGDAADRLVELALRGGGPDNVTVVVADVLDSPPDAPAVVAGAAANVDVPSHSDVGPAARAGGVLRRCRHGPPASAAGGRHARRRLLLPLVAVAVLAAVGVIGWLWMRSQYYVGESDREVAIFRGVDGAVAGVQLHSVVDRPGIPVSELGSYERSRVRDGISAETLAKARAIAERLRPVPATASTTPAPTQSPAPAVATPDATP